jgi:hypothetical protein
MTNNTLAVLTAENLASGGLTLTPSPWDHDGAKVAPGTALAACIEAGVLEAVRKADGSLFIGATAKGCRLVNEARESSRFIEHTA